jgi:hypothetical protein
MRVDGVFPRQPVTVVDWHSRLTLRRTYRDPTAPLDQVL